MSKLIFLGTGTALVQNFYTSSFLLEIEGEHLLVDGGGSSKILKQLELINFDLKELNNIFVSHRHVDHVLGVIWLLRKIIPLMLSESYKKNLTIFGSCETLNAIKGIASYVFGQNFLTCMNERIKFQVLKNGDKLSIINCTFDMFDVGEKSENQLGFKLHFEGKTLVYAGDRSLKKENFLLCKNVNYLIHEAFCLESELQDPNFNLHGHVSAKTVCELANELNVKNLILHHIKSEDVTNRKNRYLNENRDICRAELFVPNDLDIIELL